MNLKLPRIDKYHKIKMKNKIKKRSRKLYMIKKIVMRIKLRIKNIR